MPHPLELPGMLRPVVPLMRGQRLARRIRGVIHKPVALHRRPLWSAAIFCFDSWLVPRLSAVVRSLEQLPKPSARLRDVNPLRVHLRTLHVINLPACEKGPAYIPVLPLAIRRQNERTLA